MKKLVSSVFLAASLIPAVSFAQQTPNTITFKGEVTSQTCRVSINGNTTSPVILLRTVSQADFAAIGDVKGDTNFTIDLTGCNSSLLQAQATFVGNLVQASGNLGNSGTASGVSIQLANTGGTPIDFNTSATSAQSTISATGSGSLPFTARYYAEAANVGAGTVIASTQFAIDYQ